MRLTRGLLGYALISLLMIAPFRALALPEVTIGVLKGGTVSWELAVIQSLKLDHAEGFALKTKEFASPSATLIALQSGAVDLIVSDWLWVLEQRQNGRKFDYFPYSTAVGGLLVRPGVADTLCALKDKTIGVAGGPHDKNWAVARFYCKARSNVDLANENTLRYGSPPLLSALLERGQLDAVVNYWHFNARSMAKGYRLLGDTQSLLADLEITPPVPMLGWVFRDDWALLHRPQLSAFLNASLQAKRTLLESDSEWDDLRPLMHAADDKTFFALKDAWRQGALLSFKDEHITAILKTYRVLFSGLENSRSSESNKNSKHRDADDLTIHSSLFWAHN